MSIISDAFMDWRECRAEYDETLYVRFMEAEAATNGAMLNARGRDPVSLFMGNESRALAYASEELIEHWRSHPRVTFAQFERQWQRAREDEIAQAVA